MQEECVHDPAEGRRLGAHAGEHLVAIVREQQPDQGEEAELGAKSALQLQPPQGPLWALHRQGRGLGRRHRLRALGHITRQLLIQLPQQVGRVPQRRHIRRHRELTQRVALPLHPALAALGAAAVALQLVDDPGGPGGDVVGLAGLRDEAGHQLLQWHAALCQTLDGLPGAIRHEHEGPCRGARAALKHDFPHACLGGRWLRQGTLAYCVHELISDLLQPPPLLLRGKQTLLRRRLRQGRSECIIAAEHEYSCRCRTMRPGEASGDEMRRIVREWLQDDGLREELEEQLRADSVADHLLDVPQCMRACVWLLFRNGRADVHSRHPLISTGDRLCENADLVAIGGW
mmetsp:Transcript_17800/g.62453  ORF Transcript_17800/g.62453 Transcript_17800/m.62453 type:complete len:345 (+) Transcript_17800:2970-4004(+)